MHPALLGSLRAALAVGLASVAAVFAAGCAPPPRPATALAARIAAAPREMGERRQGAPREADEYTRYELLAPDTAQFHILFEVTATTPGATAYFNPIRPGSEASGESVRDRATGQVLTFDVVDGEEARRSGLPEAELTTRYIRVRLPRPVPAEGGVRLLIEKTYKDAASYKRKGADRIVFARPLGIRRNAVVLPLGYEIVACNIPSQVRTEADGRLAISFLHTGPDPAPLVIEARRLGP